MVECFFGRLKSIWRVFATTWILGEEEFDTFFDLAGCLTNLDILHRPLREADILFTIGINNLIRAEHEADVERRRRRNQAYQERRRARLGIYFD